MNTIPFDPPKMPFEYTEEQADSIMRYMQLKYRMEDVLYFTKYIRGFEKMNDNTKLNVIEQIAETANKYISDYHYPYDEAIEEAIKNLDYYIIKTTTILNQQALEDLKQLISEKDNPQPIYDILEIIGATKEIQYFLKNPLYKINIEEADFINSLSIKIKQKLNKLPHNQLFWDTLKCAGFELDYKEYLNK